jgi:hypothetical protein
MANRLQTANKPYPILRNGPMERQLDLSRRTRPGEILIQAFLFFCGAFSILTTIGIVYVLGRESMLFFLSDEVSLVEFFTSTRWQPQILEFGILPLVSATLMTTTFAMLISIPLGLSVAVYLSEYASPRARSLIKPVLEVLAGIPTIVYGYFALAFMTPVTALYFRKGYRGYLQYGICGDRYGNFDLTAGQLDERGCAQRCPALFARSSLWIRRHSAGDCHQNRPTGCHLRDCGCHHRRFVTRHWGNHDRGDRCWSWTKSYLEPIQGR